MNSTLLHCLFEFRTFGQDLKKLLFLLVSSYNK